MTNLQKIMDKEKITDHELYIKSGVHFNTIRNIRKVYVRHLNLKRYEK